MYQTNIRTEGYDKIKGAGNQMKLYLVSLASIAVTDLGFLGWKSPVNTTGSSNSSPVL